MKRVVWLHCGLFILGAMLLSGWASAGEKSHAPDIRNGRWRLELSNVFGLDSGRLSREGDFFVNGNVEYEMPWLNRTTVGIKMHPLFVYFQDKPAKTIYATGVGLTFRVYQNKEKRDGLFGELSGSMLWHTREFQGNSSRYNFFIEAGIGYKIPKHNWHIAGKWQHISNGGTGGQNAGVNALGISIGYTF